MYNWKKKKKHSGCFSCKRLSLKVTSFGGHLICERNFILGSQQVWDWLCPPDLPSCQSLLMKNPQPFHFALSTVARRPFESQGRGRKTCLPHSNITDILSVNQTRSPGQTVLRNWLSDPKSWSHLKIHFLSLRISSRSYFYYSEQMLKNVKDSPILH